MYCCPASENMSSNTSDCTLETNVSLEQGNQLYSNYLDSSNNLMSYEMFRDIEKTLQCGVFPIFFLIGAPTNILNMIIFYRQGLRDRMNLCLFCLAFTDLMLGVTMMTIGSYCLIGVFLPWREMFLRVTIMKHALNFMYGFTYSSACLTMIIAVERCVCVMFPMKAATLISTKTMAIIVLVTLVINQALCSVYIIKNKIVTVKDELTGLEIMIHATTELFQSTPFFAIVENIFLSFISFFSFTAVVVATAITVVKLHSAMIWRKSTSSSHLKGQAALMRMLVVVSSFYILCTTPNIALALARFAVPDFRPDGPHSNLFFATHYLAQLPVMFNLAVNFFIYLVMSSRFRQELSTLVHRGQVEIQSRLLEATKFSGCSGKSSKSDLSILSKG